MIILNVYRQQAQRLAHLNFRSKMKFKSLKVLLSFQLKLRGWESCLGKDRGAFTNAVAAGKIWILFFIYSRSSAEGMCDVGSGIDS